MIYLDSSDKRLLFLKEIFDNKNIKAISTNFDLILNNANNFDTVILSPAFKWDVEKAQNLKDNLKIVCGKVDNKILDIFKNKNIKYFNLMADETFVLQNAILTAEGFLSCLISNTNNSIFEQKILIIGGGRVAKSVGLLLYKLGISFDITMRDNLKLITAKLYAKNTLPFEDLKTEIKEYDTIINTIPVTLFNKDDLKYFKSNQNIFELASTKVFEENLLNNNINNTYQIQLSNNNANDYINFILCPALPAKYTPKTAGKLIFEFLQFNKLI